MRVESDERTNERTNEQLPAHVVKASLHRSKPWASYWLDRYNNNKEGIEEGLRYKPKKEWKNTSYSSRGFCKDKRIRKD
ncbi:MAG: hypothetical protein WB443_07420 [Nitrososphaeraceae archaeon]